MNSKKPDKYLPENQIWYDIDNFKNCKRDVVICPKCKHKGHTTKILNQTKKKIINRVTHLQQDYYVHHSHFILDLDKGRHVRCKIGHDYISINDSSITTMWRLKDNRVLPDWVKDELNS